MKATRVIDFYHCKNPGDYYISEVNEHDHGCRQLSFFCPCGCGIYAGIRIHDDLQQKDNPGTWAWNGNWDCPTATPSILINGGHWHGYLTNGEFVTA